MIPINLKIKTQKLELEIQNGDLARIEKTLLAAFAFIEGGSFLEVYTSTESEIRLPGSKRNHIQAVNGIREHENGTKEYKCSYSCGCGNRGIRYINEDAVKTTCHKCKGELLVAPSTANDAHDEEFNYFIAY